LTRELVDAFKVLQILLALLVGSRDSDVSHHCIASALEEV